jgi:hypothetical protein
VKQVPALPWRKLMYIRAHLTPTNDLKNWRTTMNTRSERRDHTRDINPIILWASGQVHSGCMLACSSQHDITAYLPNESHQLNSNIWAYNDICNETAVSEGSEKANMEGGRIRRANPSRRFMRKLRDKWRLSLIHDLSACHFWLQPVPSF